MVKFSNKEIFELLQSLGLSESAIVKSGLVQDIFSVLKTEPKITEDGSRELTPYETLGVMPVFEGGKEKPIVFAIKNIKRPLVNKGKYTGENLTFFYKPKKVQQEKDTLETLKSGYRRAVFMGDDENAKAYFDMINTMTGGRAKELLSSFFDYSKYYKRMKKQLVMDLFAHFFLMYIYNRVKTIKNGVNSKRKGVKPYHSEEKGYDEEYELDSVGSVGSFIPDAAINPEAFGLLNIQKVTVSNSQDETMASFDFDTEANLIKPQAGKSKVSTPEMAQFETTETVDFEQKRQEAVFEEDDAPKLFGRVAKSFLRKKERFLVKHMSVQSNEEELTEQIENQDGLNFNFENFDQIEQGLLETESRVVEEEKVEPAIKKIKSELEQNMEI